jgi:gas vesicle protein
MKMMQKFVAVVFCAGLLAGCSDQTKQEAKEMLKETGEAASSAAKDTKENVEKIGKAVEAGVERGKEEFNKDDAPTTTPADDADADGVSNADEPNP